MFWYFGREACGTLEGEVLTTGLPGKSPKGGFLKSRDLEIRNTTWLFGRTNFLWLRTKVSQLLVRRVGQFPR